MPVGINLAWTQSAPGLAIALAPLTLAAGPIVAYNVAAILMPALAAWTAFLLCRHVTDAVWPSLVGGYLFGFSTYVLGGTLAHVQTTAVFLLPLIALVLLQFFDGELEGRALAIRLGLLLAALALLETEILFTTTFAIAVALAPACDLRPEQAAAARVTCHPADRRVRPRGRPRQPVALLPRRRRVRRESAGQRRVRRRLVELRGADARRGSRMVGRSARRSFSRERRRARHLHRHSGPRHRVPLRTHALADRERPLPARRLRARRHRDARFLAHVRRPALVHPAVGSPLLRFRSSRI